MSDRKVVAVVTGGAGFIGSALSYRLSELGWEVRAFDDLSSGLEENLPNDVELVQGDLRDPEAVSHACRGADFVFHQGALRSVPRSVDDPALVNECNVAGTLNVLLAAEAADVRRVVYASSSSVYGDGGTELNDEEAPTRPLSPYAVSKLAGEQYCRVWTHLKGLSTVSLRYFNVFGPGQRPDSKYSTVFPAFVSAAFEDTPVDVHWDGEQSRDFTFIDDVVEANLRAALAGGRADGAVINIGSGRPKSINDVLDAVSEAVGRRIVPVYRPKRPGDVRRTHADIKRARDLLAWGPETDWVDAVKATVAWFQGRTGDG